MSNDVKGQLILILAFDHVSNFVIGCENIATDGYSKSSFKSDVGLFLTDIGTGLLGLQLITKN